MRMVIKTLEYAQFRNELYCGMLAVSLVDPITVNAWAAQNQIDLAANWANLNPLDSIPSVEDWDLLIRQQYVKAVSESRKARC